MSSIGSTSGAQTAQISHKEEIRDETQKDFEKSLQDILNSVVADNTKKTINGFNKMKEISPADLPKVDMKSLVDIAKNTQNSMNGVHSELSLMNGTLQDILHNAKA
ncbi:hypothetical protein SOPP22_09725 [Shewanella sp. OPT22]|nr:hypothetical protein SOPP22_09725 [Shewanella sp. OPT22]